MSTASSKARTKPQAKPQANHAQGLRAGAQSGVNRAPDPSPSDKPSYETLETTNATLVANNKQLAASNVELTAKVSQQATLLGSWEKRIATLAEAEEKALKEVQIAKGVIGNLTAEKADQSKLIGNLQSQVKNLTGENSSLSLTATKHKNESMKFQEDLDATRKLNSNQSETLGRKQREIAKLTLEVENALKEIAQLHEERDAKPVGIVGWFGRLFS